MDEKVKTFRDFDGSDELYLEAESHGFHCIMAGKTGAYWATVLADTPSAIVVMAVSGGQLGKATPNIALREALEMAIERKPELLNPESWIPKENPND